MENFTEADANLFIDFFGTLADSTKTLKDKKKAAISLREKALKEKITFKFATGRNGEIYFRLGNEVYVNTFGCQRDKIKILLLQHEKMLTDFGLLE